MKSQPTTMAELIVAYRKKKGISAYEAGRRLAPVTGNSEMASIRSWQRYEAGNAPTVERLCQIAKVLRVNVKLLIPDLVKHDDGHFGFES